ncbi:RHS repeat domain-containing protein, partial [Flavobacterium seoulense]|uniref:hypothetical protein n=1 Tax=Flavobacterium seoulense TaxID=1492738 RepID=UPI00055887F6
MKIKLTLFLIVFINIFIHSQSIPKVIPPSPNAASLAHYADIPVSNYTGVPNISIPLFNVKSGKIELPISLSYHASGIKVAQEASQVGLGWALNAGGVITRQIRGSDDFKIGGFYNNTVPPSTVDYLSHTPGAPNCPPVISPPYWGEYYHWLNYPDHLYRIDGEPDMFYFNFMGLSGQFFFQKINGTLTATCIDQNNLKIIRGGEAGGEGFTIVDGNGWKYYFGSGLYSTESTTDYDYSFNNIIDINHEIFQTRRIGGYDSSTEVSTTAWYLTKVASPEGDEIEFVYANNSSYKTLSNLNYSEHLVQLVNLSNLQDQITTANQRSSSVSQQDVRDVYLKKIVFKNGYIDFQTSDREDLRNYNGSSFILKAQKMKSAELFDLNNNSVKKIDFNYSYFNEDIIQSDPNHKEDFLRLKLDSVVESFKNKDSNTYNSLPPYVFTYNSISLPDKLSFSIDHWGYFNNKNNTQIDLDAYRYDYNGLNHTNNSIGYSYPIRMLTPAYKNLSAADVKYLGGANRDVNPEMAQAAILKKITYPTGGSMNLNYESNTYYFTEDYAPDLYDEDRIEFYITDYSDANPWEQKEATFTIYEPTLFFMDYSVYKNDYNYSSNPTSFVGQAYVKNVNGNIISFLPSNIEFNEWGTYTKKKSVFLEPGTYKLYVDKGTDVFSDVMLGAYYDRKKPVFQKNGAGLRIQSIETIDSNKIIKKKKYSYNNEFGYSTGRLLSPVSYWYNESLEINSSFGIDSDHGSYDGLTNFIVRTSNSVIPFGYSAQGKVMGYNEVTVSDIDSVNATLGNVKYFYKNSVDIPSSYFIVGDGYRVDPNNGQLLKEIYQNNNGIKVKEKSYSYNSSSIFTRAVKKYVIGFPYQQTCHYVYEPAPELGTIVPAKQFVKIFNIESNWSYLKGTTESIFDKDGNNPITTITNYKYDNPAHKNLTETQTTNSKGESIKTINKYPSDYPTGTGMASTVFDGMISKNLINPVIKQETKINDNLFSTQVTAYKDWDLDTNNDGIADDIFLPEFIKTAKGTNSLENRIQHHSYYDNGNIKEVSKTDGTHEFYIWGYKGEYPIAKIENFTSSQATAIQSLIDAAVTASDADISVATENTLRQKLNDIRNNAALSGAMISTYTYDPLIGITSITDSKGYIIYYEYDEFNRLKQVKN